MITNEHPGIHVWHEIIAQLWQEVVRNSLTGLLVNLKNSRAQCRKSRYVWPFLLQSGSPSYRKTLLFVCMLWHISALRNRKWSQNSLKGQDSSAFSSRDIWLAKVGMWVCQGWANASSTCFKKVIWIQEVRGYFPQAATHFEAFCLQCGLLLCFNCITAPFKNFCPGQSWIILSVFVLYQWRK